MYRASFTIPERDTLESILSDLESEQDCYNPEKKEHLEHLLESMDRALEAEKLCS